MGKGRAGRIKKGDERKERVSEGNRKSGVMRQKGTHK